MIKGYGLRAMTLVLCVRMMVTYDKMYDEYYNVTYGQFAMITNTIMSLMVNLLSTL